MDKDQVPETKNYRLGMQCPHCHAGLTIREAIIILNGTGYKQTAKIRTRDGEIGFADAGLINPLEVEILDD